MIIRCGELTTCDTIEDGAAISLGFADTDGKAVSLRLSFEQAESVAMTLPQLLARAVKARTGSDNTRYTFPLGQWLIEVGEDRQSFILTLRTIDGFEVSFGIPPDTCQALGWALHHEAAALVKTGAAPGESLN